MPGESGGKDNGTSMGHNGGVNNVNMSGVTSAAGGKQVTGGNQFTGGKHVQESTSDNLGQIGLKSWADDVVPTMKDRSGLNPTRQRGFGTSVGGFPRIETPRLTDMKAKQGAVVARFLNFSQRKSSLVVELYNAAFYKQKPNWGKIANFVYNDLCTTTELRKEIVDV